MENATKALIIAGGILIGILLLSMGVQLYNKYSTHAQGYIQTWDAVELNKFNSNFETYIGRSDVTAQELITLYNKIKDYENQGIKITYEIPELKDGNTIKFLQEQAANSFSCASITYGTLGQVTDIKFKQTKNVGSTSTETEIIRNGIEVTFNSNGGSAPNPTSILVTGTTYPELADATLRQGYQFAGWYTAQYEGEGVKKETGSKIEDAQLTTNHVLYAHWTPITYYVKYNGNGNTSGEMANSEHKYDEPKNLTTNAFTRTGYTFIGWVDDDGNSYEDNYYVSTPLTTISETVNLYAQWSTNGYTVTFDYATNGGTCNKDSKTVVYGTPYGDLPTASKTGNTFNGWFTEASGGTKITSTTTVTRTENHTLYAQFTPQTCTLTYDPNGGVVSPTSKTVSYGTAYGTLPTPTRAGYEFTGWYTSETGGNEVTSSTIVGTTSDHTIYAHWTNQKYTITLDNQSATTTGTTAVYEIYGDGIYLDSNCEKEMTISVNKIDVPTKEGYIFGGYYTATNGGGTQLISSSGYKTSSFTETYFEKNTTIYAKWTAKSIYVYYNVNGGTLSGGSDSLTVNSSGWVVYSDDTSHIVRSTFTESSSATLCYYNTASWINAKRTGYIAVSGEEWNTKADGTGVSFNQTTTQTYSSLKQYATEESTCYEIYLYINWIANNYTITYNVNGGTWTDRNNSG